MKKNKLILIFVSLIFMLTQSACVHKETLTTTVIHDRIIFGKTNTKELENQFGKPNEVVHSLNKVNRKFEADNSKEGSTNDLLDEYTNYFTTIKYAKGTHNGIYEAYYEYQNKDYGLEYVRFFIIDNKVEYAMYGDIVDEKSASKDPYLKKALSLSKE
ncbi:hypothetical protein [Streptococcus uberis]|uniref:hypothetical protein n=1 Tax=Streptococcus uberis TaxID=1349 RepID=UPI001FF680A3|nr:hypothetical protein [Streptococcus uberis]MCK1222891.1 hypothetical protein [Streptococcus uberis]